GPPACRDGGPLTQVASIDRAGVCADGRRFYTHEYGATRLWEAAPDARQAPLRAPGVNTASPADSLRHAGPVFVETDGAVLRAWDAATGRPVGQEVALPGPAGKLETF